MAFGTLAYFKDGFGRGTLPMFYVVGAVSGFSNGLSAGLDGNEFVPDAIERGAVAILSDQPYPANTDLTWLQVSDARLAMGLASASFYSNPSEDIPLVGVTGTNGKTTTVFLIHHLLKHTRHRAGLIGTIHYDTGDGLTEAPHTTPESPEVHRLLREMVDLACQGAAMEVSSHGLAQHRVAGVAFDVGIFTNLSQDHLDYHRSMEAYFDAKASLFEQLDGDRRKESRGLVNADDRWGAQLLKRRFDRLEMLSFGRSASADFRAESIRSDFNGTQFKLSFRERSFLVKTPLIGAFNVYNSVAAIAAAWAVGLNLREVIAAMADAPQVPGRLERVGDRQTNFRVFVDYAHTPDALINVIETLQGLNPKRIITVFGCGGDRDITKRAPMAKAAEAGSDICVLTSDNPRTEDPVQILNHAAEGFTRNTNLIIEDRADAIREAISLAGEKDIVLIAGKGHEPYQEINGVRHNFDDRLVATQAIRDRSEREVES
ncbi:MAG: UDP-N-acetylmuramoyl-L-alanyl-D-glutamate--2,6-diaminopimelate ligase [Verrucomicrobiota bacterium]